jgi:hypothetical protein
MQKNPEEQVRKIEEKVMKSIAAKKKGLATIPEEKVQSIYRMIVHEIDDSDSDEITSINYFEHMLKH